MAVPQNQHVILFASFSLLVEMASNLMVSLLLVASLLLVVRPGAPNSVLATSS